MLASADLLTAFVLFAFVSSITPGPGWHGLVQRP